MNWSSSFCLSISSIFITKIILIHLGNMEEQTSYPQMEQKLIESALQLVK